MNKLYQYLIVMCFSLILVGGASSKTANGFTFPGVDFINIDTGFDAFGFSVPGKDNAPRWDALDFTLGTGGIFDNGRSLQGGITYNYEAGFLNAFSWGVQPSQAQFDTAIESAFSVWSTYPPGPPSPLSFQKVNTTSVLTGRSTTVNNVQGADIDLFARNISGLGESAVYGIRTIDKAGVTLTSGPLNYPSSTIVASDIRLDLTGLGGNPWSLDIWSNVLIHEIGHSLGLGDVEVRPFWDTNTIINDAMSIDQLDPNNTPGLANRGILGFPAFNSVDILMETAGTLTGNLVNDDLAGRSFLYPTTPIPLPPTGFLMGLGLLLLCAVGWLHKNTERRLQ